MTPIRVVAAAVLFTAAACNCPGPAVNDGGAGGTGTGGGMTTGTGGGTGGAVGGGTGGAAGGAVILPDGGSCSQSGALCSATTSCCGGTCTNGRCSASTF